VYVVWTFFRMMHVCSGVRLHESFVDIWEQVLRSKKDKLHAGWEKCIMRSFIISILRVIKSRTMATRNVPCRGGRESCTKL
jgi:hypothetical protein